MGARNFSSLSYQEHCALLWSVTYLIEAIDGRLSLNLRPGIPKQTQIAAKWTSIEWGGLVLFDIWPDVLWLEHNRRHSPDRIVRLRRDALKIERALWTSIQRLGRALAE